MTRIALNGFGRTGRQLFKILWHKYPHLEVVAIGVTDPNRTATRALLLKYDSVYGQFAPEVEARMEGKKNCLVVAGREIPIVARLERYGPTRWANYDVDIVIDATGYCATHHAAEMHMRQGARKVIATQPMDDGDLTIIMGVNHKAYDPTKHHIISTSSDLANCLAPLAHVLHQRAGLIEGMMTTVHAVTNNQSLLDKVTDDPRLARSAHLNIVPSTADVANEVSPIIPALKGKFTSMVLRVPVPTVSIMDFTAHLAQPLTIDEANQALRDAAEGELKGVLAVTDDELVSSDFVGDTHSAIVDAKSTMTAGPLLKVNTWYDNEWGYSHRVADVAQLLAQHLTPQRNGVAVSK